MPTARAWLPQWASSQSNRHCLSRTRCTERRKALISIWICRWDCERSDRPPDVKCACHKYAEDNSPVNSVIASAAALAASDVHQAGGHHYIEPVTQAAARVPLILFLPARMGAKPPAASITPHGNRHRYAPARTCTYPGKDRQWPPSPKAQHVSAR